MKNSPQEINRLLKAVSQGDPTASESLFSIVYEELHRLAARYMSHERANHTLQPTALIHEAYLRLTQSPNQTSDSKHSHDKNLADQPADVDSTQYQDVNHFIATAAIVMRRILVNHAKAKQTKKRGGDRQRIQLDDVADSFNHSAIDLVALDVALSKLATIDETQQRLVELRFFGGMTTKQCAELLGISERAAYYEWAHAKAWLKNQIENE